MEGKAVVKAGGDMKKARRKRSNVWIDEPGLLKAVRREQKARGDESFSKTARDLMRERLVIQEVTAGKPGVAGITVIDGRILLGQLVDVTG